MKKPLFQRDATVSKHALSTVTMLLGCLVLSATTSLAFAETDKEACAKAKTEKDCKAIKAGGNGVARCKWSSNDDGSEFCKPI